MFLISIRYSTIETKETARIEYNGFICAPWPSPEYSCGKRNPSYQIRITSLVSIVSNLYNNDVIIYKINKKSREQFCLLKSLPNFPITVPLSSKSSDRKCFVNIGIL